MTDKGWVVAGGLATGSKVSTRSGIALSVQSIEWRRQDNGFTVYNFTVENNHNYFVGEGAGGAWVHNAGCDQLHHIFPQRYRDTWTRLGIPYHDYTVRLGENFHLSGVHGVGGQPFPNGLPGVTPGRWNRLWGAFLETNPGAEASDAHAFADTLMDEFGLTGLPIVPYR